MTKSERVRRIARVLEQQVPRYVQPAVGNAELTRRDPFRILIAAVLSARTRDSATAVASRRLFQVAATPQELSRLSVAAIQRRIAHVGMYRTKARWLPVIARTLLEQHGGNVPRTKTELLALPGVGAKVANLVQGLAFGVPAICVDTHVRRISHRLGLVRTITPRDTEQALQAVLPKDLWIRWNDLLVTWGQNICVPVSPWCSRCVLRKRNLCPRVGVRMSR